MVQSNTTPSKTGNYLRFWHMGLILFSLVPTTDNAEQIAKETAEEKPVTFWKSKKRVTEPDAVQIWYWKSLVQDPPTSKEEIVFVGAPWHETIENCLRKKTKVIPENIFGNRTFPNGAAILEHDIYSWLVDTYKQLGITRIFTPSAQSMRLKGLEVIPLLFKPNMKVPPAQTKDLLYSFIGATKTNKMRKQIVRLKRSPDTVIKDRGSYFGYTRGELRKKNQKEYADVLARSRFALCPSGATTLTFRFSEALWAGAVPVLITDRPIFPPGIDWSKCIICLKSKDVPRIDEIIRSIPLEQEEAMRAACLEVARIIDKDPTYFIRAYFDQLRKSGSTVLN